MPIGMTPMRWIVLVGFGIIFVSGAVFGKGPKDEFNERVSLVPPSPPERYKMVPTKTESGDVIMQPLISEAARQQSGAITKQDPEELRRQKEERIAEAKRLRRERKRLQKLEEEEQLTALRNRSISSEEFFDSKDEMAS
jgi:hypothetical protein